MGNSTLSPMRRLIRLLSLDRRDLTYIYIFGFFNGIIGLSLPLCVQALMNLVVGGRITASWGILLFFLGLGVLLNGVFNLIQMQIIEGLQRRLFARVALDFSYRLPRFRLDILDNVFAPELINRFFDTLTIQKGLSKLLVDCTAALLQMFFGLLLLSFYHINFFILGVGLLLLLIAIFFSTYKRALKTSISESKYKYKVVHWLEEVARTLYSFKLRTSNNFAMQQTDGLLQNYLSYRKAHFTMLALQYFGFVIFKTLITVGLLALGTYLVMQNEINLGEFVAAEIIAILVIGSVEKVVLAMETLFDVLTAVDKIGTVTDIPLEEHGKMNFSTVATEKGILLELKNVNFSFPNLLGVSLKNIDLTIKPNERVCISGASGSGKSVLLQLIGGLYNAQNGVIAYNGIPLGNLNLDNLRQYIGSKSAHESLFEGSLRQNIVMGNPQIDTQNLLNILQQFDLIDFMQNLPQGLDTNLSPEAKSLSQTAVQKILLARALAAAPKLLLLEDADFHLSENEQLHLLKPIFDKNNPYTLIVVSNSPLIQSLCDKVVFMENGQIKA